MATARLAGDRIEVETIWNERELIKQVPGARWDPTAKIWHLPLTFSACIVLRGVFGDDLTVDPGMREWAWPRRKMSDRMIEMRTQLEPTGSRDVVDDRLYPFQTVGAEFIGCAGGALLGDEMGTGKTIQVLAALAAYGDTLPALVICPNSVKTNWAREAEIWLPEANVYVVAGGAVGRKRVIDAALTDPRALVVVNIEATRTLSRLAPYGSTRLRRCRTCDKKNGEEMLRPSGCQVHPKELNRVPFKTVILDEAHRIKDPRSQQTRAAWALAHGATVNYRWALTGTPLANHPGDLWPILHLIAPLDFPTKTHFVDRYCLQSWNAFGGLDIVGLNPAHRIEFFRLVDPRFRRMTKAVVLSQLPPKVRTTRWVDMTTAQAKMYRELEKNLGTMTSGGVLVAANSLVARTRLMQLASSSVTVTLGDDTGDLDAWSVELREPSPKIDELEVVLDELGDRPVVVCAEHRRLIELASRRLEKRGVSHGLLTGGQPEYERERVLREFQAGKMRVLLFTIKAGGTGLTMTAADTIIFLQRADSMIDNKQAEDRVHRIGSEVHESIHVIDIVTRDTVEERQITRLYEKLMRLDEITRDRAALAQHDRQLNTPEAVDLDALEERIMGSRLSE